MSSNLPRLRHLILVTSEHLPRKEATHMTLTVLRCDSCGGPINPTTGECRCSD